MLRPASGASHHRIKPNQAPWPNAENTPTAANKRPNDVSTITVNGVSFDFRSVPVPFHFCVSRSNVKSLALLRPRCHCNGLFVFLHLPLVKLDVGSSLLLSTPCGRARTGTIAIFQCMAIGKEEDDEVPH